MTRFFLFISSLILSLLIGEGVVRVVSSFSQDVRYLANAGSGPSYGAVHSFRDFQKYYATELIANRGWRGYWANSLGFYDKEFEAKKPPQLLRVLAYGDSFHYGMVSYPDNVITVAESKLRALCPAAETEIYNLGVAATGLWDYKKLYEVTADSLKPDVVMVGIYMGNDLPDTYNRRDNIFAASAKHSFLYTLLKNSYILHTSVNQYGDESFDKSIRINTGKLGGERDEAVTIVTDSELLNSAPTFNGDGWLAVARNELLSFYDPRKGADNVEHLWSATFKILDSMVEKAAESKQKIIFFLYPSEFQVKPELIAKVLPGLQAKGRFTELTYRDFNTDLPNKLLVNYCVRKGLDCFDLTPRFRSAAEAGSILYINQDTHWNVAGNRLAGELIAEHLKPLICGSN